MVESRRYKRRLSFFQTQHSLVAQIEQEQRPVNAAKELVGVFEAKIQAAIGRVWGDGA